MTWTSYLARKKANAPRYADVPEVSFLRTYVREDMDKCLCFYDAPDEAAVRRAREAVSTPIDRLHGLDGADCNDRDRWLKPLRRPGVGLGAVVAARAAASGRAAHADVRTDLAELGAQACSAGSRTWPLPDRSRVIDDISARSLAVGFSSWAHRHDVQYATCATAPARRASSTSSPSWPRRGGSG